MSDTTPKPCEWCGLDEARFMYADASLICAQCANGCDDEELWTYPGDVHVASGAPVDE